MIQSSHSPCVATCARARPPVTRLDRVLEPTKAAVLAEDVKANFKREVLPHPPDAWINDEKTKVGYAVGGAR